MTKLLNRFFKYQSRLYKYFLYLFSVALIVFFFPRGGKFKYEYQKGKSWQYENLYAPFDFSINKTPEEIQTERDQLSENKSIYFSFNDSIVNKVKEDFKRNFNTGFSQEFESLDTKDYFFIVGSSILDSIYRFGVYKDVVEPSSNILVVKNNEATPVPHNQLVTEDRMTNAVKEYFNSYPKEPQFDELQRVLVRSIKPNAFYDKVLTSRILEDELFSISTTRGAILEGKLIIAKGEVIDANSFNVLNSLKSQYESILWKGTNYYSILFGYAILVALVLAMLMLFLTKYRPEIYSNNTKVTFIFFNILLIVFVSTLVIKNFEDYLYAVPLCILPLILKNFFDARLGLFVHVLTVLVLGFVVANSFEYIFLQIIAGIVTTLTVSELYKRANLFISAGQITLIYIICYLAFNIIQEGNLENIKWIILGLFLLNGMITLFAQPLIYIYEKIFGLVSDVSLLELSNTNSGLLKELSDKAPGTFHHSLQVANLAEAAANEIGANAMLVRVGALYHDIGKMNNPIYFTENQITNMNPHNELAPKESAAIIINHVIAGIELARKHNLPDRVIDFLRTHHGTSLVYYFFKKQQEIDTIV